MRTIATQCYIALLLLTLEVFVIPLKAQQWYFNFEVTYQEEYPLANNIRNLLIINNTFPQFDGKHDFANDIQKILFAAANTLNNNYRFESAQIINESQNTSGSAFLHRYMPNQDINHLLREYDADVAVVLNQAIFNVQQVEYETYDDYGYTSYHTQTFAVVRTNWTIEYANGDDQQFIRTDTTEYAKVEEVGTFFADMLLPQTFIEKRFLYEDSDERLTAGIEQFRYRHLDDALSSFVAVYDTYKTSKKQKNKQLAAYAAANTAVTAEMLGSLAEAEQWAKTSADIFADIGTNKAKQQQVNMLYYLQVLRGEHKGDGERVE